MRLLVSMVAFALSLNTLCADDKTLLSDDFNRDDADKVGKGWKVTAENESGVVIKDKKASFITTDEEGHPALTKSFKAQSKGKFSASFVMDFMRDFESDWAFYMQLGNSKKMSTKSDEIAKGLGVNLVWGGGISIDSEEVAILAHVKGDKLVKMTNLNNSEEEKTVVKKAVITIDVDMDAGTYTVSLNGKAFKKAKLDSKDPIDTIRFIAHNVNPDNFSSKAIDDVKVTKK